MKVEAGNGCWLTESYDIPINDRRFVKSVNVSSAEELSMWKEITDTEKEKMTLQEQLFGVEDVDYDYLNKVDVLMAGIASKINTAGLTAEQALEKKEYFPRWEELIGEDEYAGFRFQYGGTLYEVIQAHTFQEEWKPGEGTEALYKVVQVEHEGTKEDPIPWKSNMELESGKYYTEDGVLYLCVRDSGQAMPYKLSELVSVGGYVEVVDTDTEGGTDTDETEGTDTPDGSKDNPMPYTAGQTPLEKDKYYTQDGQLYVCIQDGGKVIYDLSRIPAIVQPVND